MGSCNVVTTQLRLTSSARRPRDEHGTRTGDPQERNPGEGVCRVAGGCPAGRPGGLAHSQAGTGFVGAVLANGMAGAERIPRFTRRRGHGGDGGLAHRRDVSAAGRVARVPLRVHLRRVSPTTCRVRQSGKTEDRVRAFGQSLAIAGKRLLLRASGLGPVAVR